MDEMSDKQAVEQVLNGDKEAYRFLLERYKNLVYRLAFRMLGDCDMAEDVVQEAFLIGYQHLERLRNASAFASWIAAIARNVCGNLMREKKITSVSLDYLTESGMEPSLPANPPKEDAELLKALRKAIAKIPDKYREIIELHYTEDYACEKIAAFLNLSRGAVLTRLYRARKHILNVLKKEGW